MTETEIKIRWPEERGDPPTYLERHGFRERQARTRESDQLFDRPTGELRNSDQILRLRQAGGSAVVTYKGPADRERYKNREEIEFKVSDPERFRLVLDRLGFAPGFRYEKFRTTLVRSGEDGIVTIDETPMGTFLELEDEESWIDATRGQPWIHRQRPHYSQLCGALPGIPPQRSERFRGHGISELIVCISLVKTTLEPLGVLNPLIRSDILHLAKTVGRSRRPFQSWNGIMIELVATVIITFSSVLLFGYWFRYTCLLILSAKTARDYAGEVAAQNQLGFLEVQSQLQANALHANTMALDSMRNALDRDYAVLSRMLKESETAEGLAIENRMLDVNYRLNAAWYRVTSGFSPASARKALQEMSMVVAHFANAMGEQAACSAAA